jgi:hypothetical protein
MVIAFIPVSAAVAAKKTPAQCGTEARAQCANMPGSSGVACVKAAYARCMGR